MNRCLYVGFDARVKGGPGGCMDPGTGAGVTGGGEVARPCFFPGLSPRACPGVHAASSWNGEGKKER